MRNVCRWLRGGEGLDPSKARILETASQDEVTVQPLAARRDLGKGHADLKRDAGLLRKDAHGTNRANRGGELPIQRANRRGLAAKMMRQREPSAGVRLIAVREQATARRTSPQGTLDICHRRSARRPCRFPVHGSSQLISQGMPKRSTTMPNRAAQNVFSSGRPILPSCERSWKMRSASSVFEICSESENPFGSS